MHRLLSDLRAVSTEATSRFGQASRRESYASAPVTCALSFCFDESLAAYRTALPISGYSDCSAEYDTCTKFMPAATHPGYTVCVKALPPSMIHGLFFACGHATSLTRICAVLLHAARLLEASCGVTRGIPAVGADSFAENPTPCHFVQSTEWKRQRQLRLVSKLFELSSHC